MDVHLQCVFSSCILSVERKDVPLVVLNLQLSIESPFCRRFCGRPSTVTCRTTSKVDSVRALLARTQLLVKSRRRGHSALGARRAAGGAGSKPYGRCGRRGALYTPTGWDERKSRKERRTVSRCSKHFTSQHCILAATALMLRLCTAQQRGTVFMVTEFFCERVQISHAATALQRHCEEFRDHKYGIALVTASSPRSPLSKPTSPKATHAPRSPPPADDSPFPLAGPRGLAAPRCPRRSLPACAIYLSIRPPHHRRPHRMAA